MDAPPKELPHPSQDQALLISDIHHTLHIGPKALFYLLRVFFDPTNPRTHIFFFFYRFTLPLRDGWGKQKDALNLRWALENRRTP